MKELLLLSILFSAPTHADEPGRPSIELPAPISPAIETDALKHGGAILRQEFANARGLHDYEVQSLHVQRIGCDRRIFSPSGLSIEGDADLKVTSISSNFVEAEFPTHLSFVTFGSRNPFNNGVEDVETVTSRQLVRINPWKDGQSLRLVKHVNVTYQDAAIPPETVWAVDEVRIVNGSQPLTYLIRETVYLKKKFRTYFFCQ